MALSKKSIRGLGILLSGFAIAISGFFVVKPLYEQTETAKMDLNTMQFETQAKEANYAKLEAGVDGIEASKAYVDRFVQYAPRTLSVESISRAISGAVVDGVTVGSFDFGSEENVAASEVPVASLAGNPIPLNLDRNKKEQAGAGEEVETKMDLFRRVPLVINASANDYPTLALYLDSLAQQERLITVVGVTSDQTRTSGADGATLVNATIYAYTYVYSRTE